MHFKYDSRIHMSDTLIKSMRIGRLFGYLFLGLGIFEMATAWNAGSGQGRYYNLNLLLGLVLIFQPLLKKVEDKILGYKSVEMDDTGLAYNFRGKKGSFKWSEVATIKKHIGEWRIKMKDGTEQIFAHRRIGSRAKFEEFEQKTKDLPVPFE